jgi:hypothetical protein
MASSSHIRRRLEKNAHMSWVLSLTACGTRVSAG